MALGDYVKTIAGAIAKGALNTIRGVFGAGGSIGRASELLQERFPSLPQYLANILSINEFRASATRALERQTRQELTPPRPIVEVVPTNREQFRYLVEAVAVLPDGERFRFSSHYFDSEGPLSDDELHAKMQAWLAPIFEKDIMKSPELADEIEEAQEYEFNVIRVQQRSA